MQENNPKDAPTGPEARPLDAETLLERWRHVPATDPESLRRDIDAIIDPGMDGPYRLPDRSVGRTDGGDPLEGRSWQELRDITYGEDQPT